MGEEQTIAEVVVLHHAAAAATVDGDRAVFLRHLAPELIVNSPGDRVLDQAGVTRAFELGLIRYASSESRIEHASVRPNGEILLMGEELVVPLATPNASRRLTYRFTELWRPHGGTWLLAARQATIRHVEELAAS